MRNLPNSIRSLILSELASEILNLLIKSFLHFYDSFLHLPQFKLLLCLLLRQNNFLISHIFQELFSVPLKRITKSLLHSFFIRFELETILKSHLFLLLFHKFCSAQLHPPLKHLLLFRLHLCYFLLEHHFLLPFLNK